MRPIFQKCYGQSSDYNKMMQLIQMLTATLPREAEGPHRGAPSSSGHLKPGSRRRGQAPGERKSRAKGRDLNCRIFLQSAIPAPEHASNSAFNVRADDVLLGNQFVFSRRVAEFADAHANYDEKSRIAISSEARMIRLSSSRHHRSGLSGAIVADFLLNTSCCFA